MHIVYVVTSSGRDVYTAMTRLSIASVRLANPGVTVSVVVDSDSSRALHASADRLIREVDNWVVVETPEGPAEFRNRYIKTQLGRCVSDKPFVYLDSDTIVRDRIHFEPESAWDIAGAFNHGVSGPEEQVSNHDLGIVTRMAWSYEKGKYINGGVLFVNDTERADRFYQSWHHLWLSSYSCTGDYRDQPSLNAAVAETEVVLRLLPLSYNAQIFTLPELSLNAKVWHYYSSIDETQINNLSAAVAQFQHDQAIDPGGVWALVAGAVQWQPEFWASERGCEVIRRQSRLLTGMLREGTDTACAHMHLVAQCDKSYAAQALVKTLVDNYWSGNGTLFWRGMRCLMRFFPAMALEQPVKSCLFNAIRGCLP